MFLQSTGIFVLLISLSACSSDSRQLKLSRDSFIREDYAQSEAVLYTKEVFKQSENRFVHYSSLASIAMAAGQYQKANYFLQKARDLVNSLRSSGGFSWFSSDYLSNGIEYSYLHYFLIMTNLILADEGKSAAWQTPEIKDSDGNILVAAQSFPAQEFNPREVADLRRRARAELLAWDTHLQALKNGNTDLAYYRNDLWARLLASFLHSISEQNIEKRTSELLAEDALKMLQSDFKRLPSAPNQDQGIEALIQKLKKRDRKQSLFVLEAGVMSKYKIKRFHLGISTLFKGIEDPYLRSQMEQIGLRVIFAYAPEFGLTLFAGGLAGAISGSSEDEDSEFEGPPRHFTDAIDESFGFLIQFPTLQLPPSDTKVMLTLNDRPAISLPMVSPLQEIIATEIKNREEKDMFKQAIRIGVQYLAALIPAISAYKKAEKDGNLFGKLTAVGGFYLAKKMIDNAHRPDIRSWNYLPKLIAADLLAVPPGKYQAKISIVNAFGNTERDLGEVSLGDPMHSLVRRRVGDVPNLKTPLPRP